MSPEHRETILDDEDLINRRMAGQDTSVVRERIIERRPTSNDRILNALIVAAVVALVGAVWTLQKGLTQVQDHQVLQDFQIMQLQAAKK